MEGVSVHTLTFTTKFTFGDKVRFDSPVQGRSGIGHIFAITIDEYRQIDYIVSIDKGDHHDLQPGIVETEMSLLG